MVEKAVPYHEEPGYAAKVVARKGRMTGASFDSLPRLTIVPSRRKVIPVVSLPADHEARQARAFRDDGSKC